LFLLIIICVQDEWRVKHMESFRAKLKEQGLRYAHGDIPPAKGFPDLPTIQPGSAKMNKGPKKVQKCIRFFNFFVCDTCVIFTSCVVGLWVRCWPGHWPWLYLRFCIHVVLYSQINNFGSS